MPLPNDIRNNFTSLITGRSGLYFKDHDLKNLEDSIALRMKELKLESPMSYYSCLALSEKHEDEFRELMNILTVNHTYFFRDIGQFDALREKVLPELIRNKDKNKDEDKGKGPGGKQIAIWSAGCSTGEEPYTIAIILKEFFGESIKDWDIHILATDASTSALEQARKGVYRKNAVRNIPEGLFEKYFHEVQGQKGRRADSSYRLDRSVRHMVTFDYQNLMDQRYPNFFDIIFCRNVVIYFEFETTSSVMQKFYDSLLNDGHLFIGYSETLQYMSDKFAMRVAGDGIYYKKIYPPLKERPMIEFEAAAPPGPEEKPVAMPGHDEVEEMIDKREFDRAKAAIKDLRLLDPLSAQLYYFSGVIGLEEDRLEEANNDLKKAIYLNKDFPLANFYLGQVHKKEGRLDDAIKEYRNAAKLLSKRASDAIIPLSGGFNSAVLISVCKDNIERLKMEIV